VSESQKLKAGDEVDVKIERIVPRGFGIGFAQGATIFVPLSAPGDDLRVRISRIKKRTAFAEIVEILEPGPERVVPKCPHFGVCGGCDFQQLAYSAQLEAKVAIIRDSLRRIGRIDYEGEIDIVASPDDYGYRSRARWHAHRNDRRIGYYARESHHIIDVRTCPILTKPLEATLLALKDSTPWTSLREKATQIEGAEGDGGQISIFSHDVDAAPQELTTTINGIEYSYSARTFFQANRLLVERLIELATAGLSGELALDLYCGVGLFSLPVASSFREVAGVEANAESIRFAKQNKARAGASNVSFIRKGVDEFLTDYQGGPPELTIFDPPRSGAEVETVRQLGRIRSRHISYVSCDPSILARDLAILKNYEIRSITAVDLFPQSHHVETVVRLALR
jgi:23S rRNA (uracil1939-C5)-methyltransferase